MVELRKVILTLLVRIFSQLFLAFALHLPLEGIFKNLGGISNNLDLGLDFHE